MLSLMAGQGEKAMFLAENAPTGGKRPGLHANGADSPLELRETPCTQLAIHSLYKSFPHWTRRIRKSRCMTTGNASSLSTVDFHIAAIGCKTRQLRE